MIVTFKTREISRGMRKLIQAPTLILKKISYLVDKDMYAMNHMDISALTSYWLANLVFKLIIVLNQNKMKVYKKKASHEGAKKSHVDELSKPSDRTIAK
jgi:hypothetical protein